MLLSAISAGTAYAVPKWGTAGVKEIQQNGVCNGVVTAAGRYDAVRIDIGSGGGRNWWCVLYPGLCSFAQGGYALPAENDLVCGQYILRFRLVDWAHRLTARRQTVLLVG